MKKFRFRLRTVKRQREIIEDLRKREVGQAKQAVEVAKDQKNDLEKKKEDVLLGREQLAESPALTSAMYQIMDNFLIGTKQQIVQKEHEIETLNEEVRRRMSIYLEAFKRKKIMDTIHDKAKETHRKTELKEQEKRDSDLFTIRFTHDNQKKAEEGGDST